MPFTVPTFQAILARIKADFRAILGVDPQAATVEYAIVRAEAAQSKGQYAYGTYIKAQCFPDTADEAHFWRWAAIWGVYQLPATCWTGTYRFTGTDSTPIPIGTELSRADGQLYITSNAVVVGAGGTVDVGIAGKPGYEGAAGNNDPGQPLTLSTPIAGIDSEGVVTATLIDGADLESQAQGLKRLLSVIQSNVPGGGIGDYVTWALEVPGVTRAWETPIGGAVAIAFVRDNDGPGIAILPDPAEAEQVRAHVQSKAPITVFVSVVPLVAVVVDFTMSVVPNTPDVHAAVQAELTDFFLREAEPGATLDISRINAAISAAAGETSHILTAPTDSVVTDFDEMAILGTVEFVL